MEYEIEDQGEDALFDESTNPSLKHDEDDEEALFFLRSGKRKLQKGELIPEEEQLA